MPSGWHDRENIRLPIANLWSGNGRHKPFYAARGWDWRQRLDAFRSNSCLCWQHFRSKNIHQGFNTEWKRKITKSQKSQTILTQKRGALEGPFCFLFLPNSPSGNSIYVQHADGRYHFLVLQTRGVEWVPLEWYSLKSFVNGKKTYFEGMAPKK